MALTSQLPPYPVPGKLHFLVDCLVGFGFIMASSATQLLMKFCGICVLFWYSQAAAL